MNIAKMLLPSVSATAIGACALNRLMHRSPYRRIVTHGMCSPADGKVTNVSDDKIHILIRIYDVHIIRAPLSGTIESVTSVPGNTTPCVTHCPSTNRHKIVTISTSDGDIDVLLIHGAITKVIKILVSPGDNVEKGAQIGHILLGSGCITDIPPNYIPVVKPGDLVYAGSSPIATCAR